MYINIYGCLKPSRHFLFTLCLTIFVFAVFAAIIQWIMHVQPYDPFDYSGIRSRFQFLRSSTPHEFLVYHPKFPNADSIPFDTRDETEDSRVNHDFKRSVNDPHIRNKIGKKRDKREVNIHLSSEQRQSSKRLLEWKFRGDAQKTKPRINAKLVETNTDVTKHHFNTFSNSLTKFIGILMKSARKRIKRQLPKSIGKNPNAKINEQNKANETLERQKQGRILQSLRDFIPSFFRGTETKPPNSDQNNMNTPSVDQGTDPSKTIPTNMSTDALSLGFENCDVNCNFDVESNAGELKNNTAIETTQDGKLSEPCDSCKESLTNTGPLNSSIPAEFNIETTQEFLEGESFVTTSNFETDEDVSAKSHLRSFTIHDQTSKPVKDVNSVDSNEVQTESVIDKFNVQEWSLDNLASGERSLDAFKSTTELNDDDWLLNYCFERLLNRSASDELLTTWKTEFDGNISDSENVRKLNHPILRNLRIFSKPEEQVLMNELELSKNKSDRGARFLHQFSRLFDFFGSGSSARMVDENAKNILFDDSVENPSGEKFYAMENPPGEKFDDEIKNPPREKFDDNFVGEECLHFFHSILRGQTRIAKPNLIDLLTVLRTELTETPNSVLTQTISNLMQRNTDTTTVPSLTAKDSELTNLSTEFIFTDSLSEDQTSFSDNVDEITQTAEGVMTNFDRSVTTREGRFLSIFGFGSGESMDSTGEEKPSDEKSDRSFFGNFFNFGSGAEPNEEATLQSVDESKPNSRRLWNIFEFGSGDARELPSIETSSVKNIQKLHRLSDPSNSDQFTSAGMDESDTATPKMRRFFGSLFDSSNSRLSSVESLTTDPIPTTNKLDATKANLPESEGLSTKNSKRRFFGNIFDFGSGESRDLNEDTSKRQSYDGTTEPHGRIFFGSMFGVGSGESLNSEWESTKIDFMDSTEPHERRFLGNIFGFGSGAERVLEESGDILETVTNAEFTENSTNDSRRFFFIPDFGSGEIVFEPQGENESPPPLEERRFFGNLFDFGSGESRSQNVVTDSTVTNVESNMTTIDWTGDGKLSKRVGIIETDPNTEAPVSQGSSSDLQDFRTRGPRFHAEPEIQCNECEYESIEINAVELSTPKPSEDIQDSFADCDENSCQYDSQLSSSANASSNAQNKLEQFTKRPATYVDDNKNSSSVKNENTNNEFDVNSMEFNASAELHEGCENDCESFDMSNATSDKLKHTIDIECGDECDWGIITESTSIPGVFSPATKSQNNDNEYFTHVESEQDVTTALKKNILINTSTLPSKYCFHASQCDSSLNERCVFNGSISVCDCGRSFVRHPVSRKCEPKIVLETILRFPNEVYNEELKNPESEIYKNKIKDANEMMRILLNDNVDLMVNVAGFNVTGFSEGSLVVYWNLVLLAVDNETVDEIGNHVIQALSETLTHKEVLMKAPFKTANVTILRISRAIDPCRLAELNYCSRFAVCIRDNYRSGGFVCQCKDGNLDFSENRDTHPGEVCEVICPSNYCGKHGDCKVNNDGERECLCKEWYLGNRCELSGLVLVISIASTNIIFILLVIFCVWCIRRRKRRHAGYGSRHRNFIRALDYRLGECDTPQVADVVALNERLAFISKFNKISQTPALLPPPANIPPEIKVIPPSVSDVSYSVDSSFDTPSDMSSRSARSSRSPRSTSPGTKSLF